MTAPADVWIRIALLTLCLVQAAVIGWLLMQRRRARLAAQAARASERRYRDVVEAQSELICRYRPDTTLTFVNDAYCRFFGRTRDDLLGRRFLELVPVESRAAVEDFVRTAIRTRAAQSQEHQVIGANGQKVWQYWTDTPLADERGEVRELQGIGIDVTARRDAEDAIRESEARATAVLRAIPDLMFLQDRRGVYLDYHARDPSALLVPASEFLGRSMADVLPADLTARFFACFEEACRTGGPAVTDYDLEINGERRYFESRMVPCEPDRVLSIVRDQTDRVRAELAVRDARERYALATTAGRVGVWEWNMDAKEVLADAALVEMLGVRSASEVRSASAWTDWLHPDDRDRVSAVIREHVEGRAPIFETECRVRRPDGSDIWVFARGALEASLNGGQRRLIGTCIDVSERRQAEEALRRAQADVARLSRLTAMGELAASIAHEVNQPLCAIVANAQAGLRALRADGSTQSDLIRDALADVVADGRRASEVIQRTRQLFIERQEAKALVSLNGIIRSVAVLAGPAVEGAAVHATYELHPSLPPVVADPVLLQQVILNLIMNAIEAMSDAARRELQVATALGDEGVVVAVRDSGRGLHPDQAQEIFHAFHTTKPEGMGMGLAISRAIVAAHGGRLWAEANTDAGATFQIVIPVAGGSSAAHDVRAAR